MMADPFEFERPGGPLPYVAPQDPMEPQAASGAPSLLGALDDPRVRGALLQFGLAMMQPQHGQTGSGYLAQGLGAAGEYLGRQDEEKRKERTLANQEKRQEARDDYYQGSLAVRRDQAGTQAKRAASYDKGVAVRKQNADSIAKRRDVQNLKDQAGIDDDEVAPGAAAPKLPPAAQEQARQNAKARIARDPASRNDVLKKLEKFGISTEGL